MRKQFLFVISRADPRAYVMISRSLHLGLPVWYTPSMQWNLVREEKYA
jgi:hypothetical protein